MWNPICWPAVHAALPVETLISSELCTADPAYISAVAIFAFLNLYLSHALQQRTFQLMRNISMVHMLVSLNTTTHEVSPLLYSDKHNCDRQK